MSKQVRFTMVPRPILSKRGCYYELIANVIDKQKNLACPFIVADEANDFTTDLVKLTEQLKAAVYAIDSSQK